MAVKLIAVDMDGTFLNPQHEYNKIRFREQYQQLLARDIKFVVASGNQYYQLKSFFDDIDEQIAYVAEGGGYVVDKKKKFIAANSNLNRSLTYCTGSAGHRALTPSFAAERARMY